MAIAALVDETGASPSVIGTAFAYSRQNALTAFHCVGDREQGTLSSRDVVIRIGSSRIPGSVIEWDHLTDYALLELKEPIPSEYQPIPLTTAVHPNVSFTSKGWPSSRPFPDDSLAVSGFVTDPYATLFSGHPALQLFCQESAAGLALQGLSGAPVLVESHDGPAAAGIIRWNPPKKDGSGSALGGIVYACPMSGLIPNSPQLRGYDFTSPDSRFLISYAETDIQWAEWIFAIATERGHHVDARFNFLRPGDNVRVELRSALDSYQNVLVVTTERYGDSEDELSRLEREMVQAHPGRKIPVVVRKCEAPGFLCDRLPIDLTGLDEEASATALVSGLLRTTSLKGPRFAPFPGPVDVSSSDPLLLRRSVSPQIRALEGAEGEGL
jgi:hypothetical protein